MGAPPDALPGDGKKDLSKRKSFPLENILTSSAGDWIQQAPENFPRGLSYYKMVGVHVDNISDSVYILIEEFAEQVPEDAVVVVDYCPAFTGELEHGMYRNIASGTALILKKDR